MTRTIARFWGVVLAAAVIMTSVSLSTGTVAQAAAASYPPPNLLNETALTTTPQTNDGAYYAGGLYSATAPQLAALHVLEAQAVADVVHDHELSSGDGSSVLSWARPDAQADLWGRLLQAVQAVHDGTASDVQRDANAWLAAVQQRQAVLMAQDAGLEYTKWAGLGTDYYRYLLKQNPSVTDLANFLGRTPNPYTNGASAANPQDSIDGGYCVYRSPAPLQGDYTANVYNGLGSGAGANETCYHPCTNLLGCPLPTPSYANLTHWGAADTQNRLFGAFGSASALDGAAVGGALASLGAVTAGVGTSFSLGSTLSGTAFQQAVFPFAARVQGLLVTAAEDAAIAAGESAAEAAAEVIEAAEVAGGELAASGVGAIVSAVIFAVTTAVQVGLQVVADAALPGQLASLIVKARTTTPDPYATASSNATGLIALVAGAALPAPSRTTCDNSNLTYGGDNPLRPCGNATTIPAATAWDPAWVVTPQGGTPTMQPDLAVADTTTGLTSTERLHGNWVITSATIGGTSATAQGLRLHYSDWGGGGHTAWVFAGRAPAQFLTVADAALGASFDPSTCAAAGTCALTGSIQLTGPGGARETVALSPGGEAPPLPPDCLGNEYCPTHATSTTLQGPTSVPVGTPVTFTAHVDSSDGQYAETGYVDVVRGQTPVCTAIATHPADDPTRINPGTAADCTMTFSTPGTYFLFATYSGNSVGFPSQGELTVVATVQQPTSTTLSAPAAAVVGQHVPLTATVGSPAPGVVPGGTVTFTAGATTLCTAVPVRPAATAAAPYTATCTPSFAVPTSVTLIAAYSGDPTTLSSSGQALLTVSPAVTTTQLSASTGTAVVGQQVTYTAQVAVTAPGATVPTGTVSFSGGASCSSVALSAFSTATCTATYASTGERQVVATYAAGTTTLGSTGGATTAVGKATTSLSLVAAPGTTTFGQQAVLTATAAAVAPSTAGPELTGSVAFSIDGLPYGPPVALTAGRASTAAPASLTPGPHSFTATYSGDAAYVGSTGSAGNTVRCDQLVTGNRTGGLQVSTSGCVQDATVSGSITVAAGGTLALLGATVNGTVTVTGGGTVLICGSRLQGALSVTRSTGPVILGGSGCAANSFTAGITIRGATAGVTLAGSVATAPVALTDNAGGVTVTGTTLGAPLAVTGNRGLVSVNGNTSTASVTVSSNTSPPVLSVSDNTISGGLGCTGNTPPPTAPGGRNRVSGTASGQCSGLT